MSNSFITAMKSEQIDSENESATTWNGAKSYATTSTVTQNGALVNYLFKALRSAPKNELEKLWVAAKSESHPAASLLAFFTRDRFKGKGERLPFQCMLQYEARHGSSETIIRWLPLISYFGYPKDLLCLGTTKDETNTTVKRVETEMLTFYCSVLLEDKRRSENSKQVTTFAKFAPTENGEHDKKFGFVGKMCKILTNLLNRSKENPFTKKEYRTMLASLRSYCQIPERLMCLNLWHTIKFSAVPSRCMHNNKKAFEKHAPQEWAEYVKQLESGETKVNSNLFPHDLAAKALHGGGFDQVAESQWKTMQAKAKKEFAEFDMSGILVMADTSASMKEKISKDSTVQCMDASIGLGLFFAELLPEPWKDCVLTFTSVPRFHKAQGTNLAEKLRSLKEGSVENTNFQAALDLILNTAVENNVARSDMPSILLAISDMQFDRCGPNDTNFSLMKKKFASTLAPDGLPYSMPSIVFWNVQGKTTDYPAQADSDSVAMLSGFSPGILRLVFTGELNPVQVVRRAISDPRYDVIVQQEEVNWKKFLYADFDKRGRDGSEKNKNSEEEEEEVGELTKKVKVVEL